MTITLGLTGGIATGKSTVAEMLVELGAGLIDADKGARVVVAPGSAGLQTVVARFGSQILRADGTLDRACLGQIVFNQPEQKQMLESILHPLILQWMKQRLQDYVSAKTPLVVLDIPLLFETGVGLDLCDYTAVVWVPPQVQLERLIRRNHFSDQEARARIKTQMSIDEKRAMADFTIDNSGLLEDTKRQVIRLWQQLLGSRNE
jgi:dephospho-CoA kinase